MRVINTTTRGKAKSEYFRDLKESWDIPFKDIRVRKLGCPVQTDGFLHTAKYRGVADVAKIGGKVKVNGSIGYIVGNNASANFDVLFEDGPYKGLTLNCHPNSEIEYL
jgi:hypothetical protein